MKKLILILTILFITMSLFAYQGNPDYPYSNSDAYVKYQDATSAVAHVQPRGYGAVVYFTPYNWKEYGELWKVTIAWNPHKERYEETNFETVGLLWKNKDTSAYATTRDWNEYGPPRHTQMNRGNKTILTQFYDGRREILIRYTMDVVISNTELWLSEEVHD